MPSAVAAAPAVRGQLGDDAAHVAGHERLLSRRAARCRAITTGRAFREMNMGKHGPSPQTTTYLKIGYERAHRVVLATKIGSWTG